MEITKDTVLDSMNKHDIVRIDVEYNGSGDEGFIENIYGFDSDGEEVPTPKELTDGGRISPLEEYSYALLSTKHPGWEINEGSYGTIRFDLVDRKCQVLHNYNIMTSEQATSDF